MSYHLAMSHIRWVITRENGVLVPLVAVDELPLNIQLQGVPRGLSINDVKGKEFLGEVPATSFSFSLIQTTFKDNKPAYVSPMPGFDHTIAKRTGTFADTPTDNAQYDRLDNAEPLVLALNQKLPRPDFGPVGKPCTPPNTQRSSFSSDSTWRNGDNRLTTNDQVCMP